MSSPSTTAVPGKDKSASMPPTTTAAAVKDESPTMPPSTTTVTISRSDLDKFTTPPSAFITDVKALSSYNWIEAPATTPTIAVPGSPDQWSPPAPSKKPLPQDSGLIYIAQNAARHPSSPLEPLFRALYATHPSFDIKGIDVITDRNNIRKLLSFVDPSPVSARNGTEPFTINIEVNGDTAIFCRHETKTSEVIGGDEFRGFGHEFEKAYTKTLVDGSTGHHRIISYDFGGLKFVVRFETDGFVVESASKTKTPAQDDIAAILGDLSLSTADRAPISSVANLPGQMGDLSLSSDNAPTSKLVVRNEGKVIPMESTLEIKTRTIYKRIEMHEVLPQLWVSQTPKLVRAYHKKGVFEKPAVDNVAPAIRTWEKRKQDELRKLAALMRRIIGGVKDMGGNAVLRYVVEGDKLVIEKKGREEILPRDLYAKWDVEEEVGVEVGVDDQKDQGDRGGKDVQKDDQSVGTRGE